ncbi:MAG: cytochrome c oxidase assembly protein [bacterium]
MNAALAAGAGVLALAWIALPRLGLPPFTGHMVMHMSVVALAAPLIALGLAGGRWDPVRRWPALMSPVVASMAEAVLVWGWHAPALHHAARQAAWARAAEQGSFLLAGLWLWCAALGGGAATRRARAAGGVAGLLLTSMHMTLLGALITLSHRPLYGHGSDDIDTYCAADGSYVRYSLSGFTPLHDQQLGGAVMLVAGGLAYLLGGIGLAGDVMRRREAR